MMTEIEKAWMACAIDSEGSLAILHNGGDGKAFAPVIKIYNTHKPFLEKALAIIRREYGVGTIHEQPARPRYFQKKPLFSITIANRKVQAILAEILPYLIIKYEKALELMAFKGPAYDSRPVNYHQCDVHPPAKEC